MTGCRIICPKGKHLFLERQADDIFIKQSEFGKGKSKSQVRVSEGLRRISFLLCLKISVSSCLREAPRGRLGLGPPLLSVVLSALSSRPFPLYPPVLCEISSHSRSTSWISSCLSFPVSSHTPSLSDGGPPLCRPAHSTSHYRLLQLDQR